MVNRKRVWHLNIFICVFALLTLIFDNDFYAGLAFGAFIGGMILTFEITITSKDRDGG